MKIINLLSLQSKALLLDTRPSTITRQPVNITFGSTRLNGRTFLLKNFADHSLHIGGGIDLPRKLAEKSSAEEVVDDIFRTRVQAQIKTGPEALNALTLPLDRLEVETISGTNGILYRVSLEERNYMIKVILGDSKTSLTKALREITLPLGINHPNIVKVHGSALVNNRPSIVMEDVPGIDGSAYGRANKSVFAQDCFLLKDIIKKTPESLLQLERTAHRFAHAMHLFKELLSGIEHLQSLNLVHRDLKLSNIIINGGDWSDLEITEGQISGKILDLGFIRRLPTLKEETSELPMLHTSNDFPAPIPTLKRTYSDCGTFGWLAPEIIKMALEVTSAESPEEQASSRANLAYDGKLDMFGLGAIFYGLFLNRLVQDIPETKPPSLEYLSKTHLSTPLFSLRLPPNLRSLLGGLLEKDPYKRSSIAQVKENPLMALSFNEIKTQYTSYINDFADKALKKKKAS